jgi:hypothetical protein
VCYILHALYCCVTQLLTIHTVGGEKSKVVRAALGNVDGYTEPERVLGKRLHSNITTANTATDTAVTTADEQPAGDCHVTVM